MLSGEGNLMYTFESYTYENKSCHCECMSQHQHFFGTKLTMLTLSRGGKYHMNSTTKVFQFSGLIHSY